jgi:hypothetical protein
MRRALVLTVVLLAVVACTDQSRSANGGGSGAPALANVLEARTKGAAASESIGATADGTVPPTTLGDGPEGFEHSTNALRVLGDDPELDALAVDCHQGDLMSCDDLYVGSPDGSLYEAYGATCGARVDQPTHQLCGDVLVGVPTDPPSTGDEFLDELAYQCSAGDLVDCDLLYAESDTGSEAERYGATCGGRLETDEDCAQLVT